MAKTYTVLIPAPEGHTGSLPVQISGTDGKENYVRYDVKIPYGEEVSGVAEAVAKYVEKNVPGAVVTEEKEGKPAKKGKKPAEGPPAGDDQGGEGE